jgi:hypothetical protein
MCPYVALSQHNPPDGNIDMMMMMMMMMMIQIRGAMAWQKLLYQILHMKEQ